MPGWAGTVVKHANGDILPPLISVGHCGKALGPETEDLYDLNHLSRASFKKVGRWLKPNNCVCTDLVQLSACRFHTASVLHCKTVSIPDVMLFCNGDM